MKDIKAAIKQLEGLSFDDVETLLVIAALERAGGSKTVAAAELGVSLKTIYNHIHNAIASKSVVGLVKRYLEAEPCSPPKIWLSFCVSQRSPAGAAPSLPDSPASR